MPLQSKAEYDEVENRLNDALRFKAEHPEMSYRFLEKQFKVSKDKIRSRYMNKHGSRYGRPRPDNSRLSREEDKDLCHYLEHLVRFRIPLTYRRVSTAAIHIMQTNNPGTAPLGEKWTKRWAQVHPQFTVIREKTTKQTRADSMNVYNVREWFRQIKATMTEYNIQSHDFWSMGEMELQLGVGRGNWVIGPAGDESDRYSDVIGTLGDREQCTIVESVSAGGNSIPPFAIIKGTEIKQKWFSKIPPELRDMGMGVSESGCSNDILFSTWLQHWEYHTRTNRRGEHRLLLLDGYDSRLTFSTLKFCEQHKVIIVLLPPLTSHILQPLDVSVFQQWKHHHSELLDQNIKQGVGLFDKDNFFAYLHKIRQATILTEPVVKAGFQRCGYFPFRPRVVLTQLVADDTILNEMETGNAGMQQDEEENNAPPPPLFPPAVANEPFSGPL